MLKQDTPTHKLVQGSHPRIVSPFDACTTLNFIHRFWLKMASLGLSGDIDFRQRIYHSSSSGSKEPQRRRPLQSMKYTLATFCRWNEVVVTKSSWNVEKLSSLKFQCQDSYEYLIDRMLDLKSKTQQMLNENRVDEARSTSLFVGGIVLKLFEEGATEETRSKWTHGRMTVALSTPWWYRWAEVAYPSLPYKDHQRHRGNRYANFKHQVQN